MKRIVLVWIIGMVTAVPAAIYHIFFVAETIPFWIFAFVFFWVFGYWTVMVPFFKFYRVRKLYKKISSREDLLAFIKNGESREVAVSLVARDSGVPEFIVERFYDKLSQHIEKTDFKFASDPPR